MNSSKSAIRRELRAVRRALPQSLVDAAGRTVCAAIRSSASYRDARAVLAYLAHENEIPVADLFEEIQHTGRTLYLPGAGPFVGTKPWHPGAPLTVGRGGVLEPHAGVVVDPLRPLLAVVPLVAWNMSGWRLGRGSGYYDRLLGALAADVHRVGIGYEFQQWPGFPCDSWDIPLHSIITEQRTVDFPATTGRSELQKGGAGL